MQISQAPVTFANRAKFQSATYSVGAHMPEHIVMLNVYSKDGLTTVLQFTPDEARETALHPTQSANSVEG